MSDRKAYTRGRSASGPFTSPVSLSIHRNRDPDAVCTHPFCVCCLLRPNGAGGPSGSKRLGFVGRAVQYPPVPPESQPPTPDPTPRSPPAPTTSATPIPPLELWEADLTAFLRASKAGARTDPGRGNAQEFADRLDAVRLLGNTISGPLTMNLGS